MLKRKRIRDKRRISLSKYFQELKKGDKVAIVRNLSFKISFPRNIQGSTGTIVGKQGRSYIVKLLKGKTYKNFTIKSIHLKKLK